MDSNYTYLCYGLIAAWGIIALYVVSLALREKNLRQELDRVKRMVEDREAESKIKR